MKNIHICSYLFWADTQVFLKTICTVSFLIFSNQWRKREITEDITTRDCCFCDKGQYCGSVLAFQPRDRPEVRRAKFQELAIRTSSRWSETLKSLAPMQLWNLRTTRAHPLLDRWTLRRPTAGKPHVPGLGQRGEALGAARPIPHFGVSPAGGFPRSPEGVHFRIDSHMGHNSEVVHHSSPPTLAELVWAAVWSTSHLQKAKETSEISRDN